MAPLQPFGAAAASWQSFYLLTGTAAATLIGLMFVAVTFGSTIMTKASSTSARAFLDPTFTHFVQVLVTACLMVVPSMTGKVMGVLLLSMSLLRAIALVRVHREMKHAHSIHHDIELSDWLMGIAIPLLAYLLVGVTGAGFITGHAAAFDALAVGTGAVLLNGIYGAWELLVWLAVTRTGAQ